MCLCQLRETPSFGTPGAEKKEEHWRFGRGCIHCVLMRAQAETNTSEHTNWQGDDLGSNDLPKHVTTSPTKL